MTLTPEQRGILDGEKGETLAKVMKTLVMYGETFGAERMVPVTGEHGHLVTSFGLSVMKPLYALMDQLIAAGAVSKRTFTVDPRPMDPNVPANLLQTVFFKVMYSQQAAYEAQLGRLGLLGDDAYTCACYQDEVGNIPKPGDVLSWAESSAVVYANSVLGARCNRNSGILELFGGILGFVPEFGLLTDEGRRASWVVEVRTSEKPEAQLLGSAIGMQVQESVPYIEGLSAFLGTELDEANRAFLKDMGAATASNGAVGLYHVDGLTPEAKALGTSLVRPDAKVYVVDDAELRRVKASYPDLWKKPDARPKLCFVGCPHLSRAQLDEWTGRLEAALSAAGRRKVAVPTVFTAAPAVLARFRETPAAARLAAMGVVLSSICPLMYMNNPMCHDLPVLTNSNKLRTYSTSRYATDAEILAALSKGGR